MGNLIRHGRVDPQGMIAQALSARGLQTESRDNKTFLVRPQGAAAGGVAVGVRHNTEGRQSGCGSRDTGGRQSGCGSSALVVGGRVRLWLVAAVSESVILPPGVVRDEGESGVYWVGPAPQGRGAAAAKSLLERMRDTVLEAAVAAPVIMLRPALDEQRRVDDLRDLRRLVQQFALKQQQPLVIAIAIDSASTPLEQLLQAYGVTILRRVPGDATGAHATTSANLDNTWLITNGRTTITKGKNFTKSLVEKAAAIPVHTRPRPVTPALARLLLTPDRAAKLDLLTEHRAALHTELARGELDAIITATESDAWFRQTRRTAR